MEKNDDLPLEIGKLVVQKKGLGQDLLALRDYQPMDDLRRLTGKRRLVFSRLIVREFSAEDEKRITVVFDPRLRKSEKEKPKTLRQKIEDEQKGGNFLYSSKRFEKGVAGRLALSHFTEEQADIRLIIAKKRGDYQIGRTHLYDNLKRLALIEPNFQKRITFDDLSENLEQLLETGIIVISF